MSRSAAAVVTDLIFATKISSSAKAAGVPVKIVRTIQALADRLEVGNDGLVFIDLNAEGIDALEAIRLCRSAVHRPRTIAYAAHVQVERIAAAREAGAGEVMARSAFVARLPSLLADLRDQDVTDL